MDLSPPVRRRALLSIFQKLYARWYDIVCEIVGFRIGWSKEPFRYI